MARFNKGQGISELLLVLGLLVLVAVFALPGLQGAIVSAYSKLTGALDANAGSKPVLLNLLSYKAPSLPKADWGSASNAPSSEDPPSSQVLNGSQNIAVSDEQVKSLFSEITAMKNELKNANLTEVTGGYGQLTEKTLALALALEAQAKKLDANDPNKSLLEEAARYGKALAGVQAKTFVARSQPYTADMIYTEEQNFLKIKALQASLAAETGLFEAQGGMSYLPEDPRFAGSAKNSTADELSVITQKFEEKYNAASAGMLAAGFNEAQKQTTDQAATSIKTKAQITTVDNAKETFENSEIIEDTKQL